MIIMATQLTAQERAHKFAQATRQNLQMLPSQIVAGESTTIQFVMPKARYLSKIYLNVEAVATLKSSAASIALDTFSPYKMLRRIALDMNNGFAPIVLAGRELAMYNLTKYNANQILAQQSNARQSNYIQNAASVGGTTANIKFTLELPIALNDRDAIGLVMLQNEASQVTLTIDIDTLAKAYSLNAVNNDQVIFNSMTITPMTETFTIPSDPNAQLALDTLKLVSAKGDNFTGQGQAVMKLNVGTIYRKMLVYLEDTNGVPLNDTDLTGNLELVFNQADVPYAVKPTVLAHKNNRDLGYVLPAGLFLLDFSTQGTPNYGGSRDLIDTSRLTEFWLRYNPTKAGKITVVSEVLSHLR